MATLEIEIEESRPVAVTVTEERLIVRLADGREVSTPLAWYPRLEAATPAEREVVELGPFGIHWPQIDEDLSIAGMLRGAKAAP